MPAIERVTLQMLRLLEVLTADPDREWWGLALADSAGVHSPTVYRSLARLEAAQWVVSRVEEAVPSEEGRPRRRLYKLTPSGAREAVKLVSERQEPPMRFARSLRPGAMPA